ncbi:MAG: Na+/H+ antiporter NhaC family protein [Bacteroidales bacterium]|nr:Na+/H+ antiporter NhaC family protein [Bacteroidales bacterium]
MSKESQPKPWAKHPWMSLSPLVVFLLLYLVTSILLNDFYKVPITVAFMFSSIYAILITRGIPLDKRIAHFSEGAGNRNMMLMIWIFVLAGAFAQSAKNMGSIDATVNLTLHILPENMLLPGLFLAACFISLSIGTSVGTIVALTPVAVGISQQTGCVLPLIVATVVGGAFFGDNLSFISDTTIIATQTQGCRMRDKFLVNCRIVVPAALLVLILYIILGADIHAPKVLPEVEWVKVIPYLAVLITAVWGLNVMAVLLLGVLLTGVVGMGGGYVSFWDWFGSMGEGILGMGELIIITLMAGGMLELIRYNGGIEYLTSLLTKSVRGKRGAEYCIGFLVMLADMCTANNTVAIITVGPIANNIATRFGVDKRKSASILDTFSCFAQGLIPYGAQMLMAAGLAQLAPTAIMGYLYYPFAIGAAAFLSILFRYPKKYS